MKLKEYKITIGDNTGYALSAFRTHNIKSDSLFSSYEIINMLNECFDHGNCAYEYVYIIGYDEGKNPIGIMEIGHGDEKSCPCPIDKISTFLLLTGSKYYSLIHNHPNGVMQPSKDDMNIYMHCLLIGKCFDRELLSDIIIHKNEYIETELSEEYCEKNGIYDIKDVNKDTLPNKISELLNENGLTSVEYYVLDNFINEMYRTRTSEIVDGGVID